MPIKVSCHCGQSFMAKDDLRGQTLLCPKCHEPLTIGEGMSSDGGRRSAGGIADLFDEVGLKEVQGPRCPRCAAALKPNAVLCVECGFNLQTQEQLQAARVRKAGERGHGEAAEDLLERAVERIKEDKLEERKNRSQGMPAWMIFLALCIVGGFTVAMFLIPRDQAFQATGFTLIGICALANLYFQIRLLIIAFSTSTASGIMYIVIPFYSLYFIITHWDDCGGLFLMSLGAGFVSSIGWGVVALAPMMAESGDAGGQAWRQFTSPRYAVVAAYDPQPLPQGITL